MGEKEFVSNEKRKAVASYQKVSTPVTKLCVFVGCWLDWLSELLLRIALHARWHEGVSNVATLVLLIVILI